MPEGFDIDTHFTPAYEPWDQRLCFCPDGDLFRALRAGRMEIVTEEIEANYSEDESIATPSEGEPD